MSNYVGKEIVKNYLNYRPEPSLEIIENVLNYLPNGKQKQKPEYSLAIDVGCGSGQMTKLLAPHFKNVIGIDSSADQIQQAKSCNLCPNILYREGGAVPIDVPNNSTDLVIVCQAVHWFDSNEFYSEVARILNQDGILALVGYTIPEPQYKDHTTKLTNLVKKFFSDNESLWHEKNKLLMNRYQDIQQRYEHCIRIDPVPVDIEANLSFLMEHLWSRSGIQNLKKKDPSQAQKIMDQFQNSFMAVLESNVSSLDLKLVIRFNYFLIILKRCDIVEA